MKDDILDLEDHSEKVQNHSEEIQNSIQWWEKKRKPYNIMLLSIAALSLIDPLFTDDFNIDHLLLDMLEAGIWIFGANLFYSLGLGVELSIRYYRKKDSETVRNTFFVCGLLFSGLWSFWGFAINSFY